MSKYLIIVDHSKFLIIIILQVTQTSESLSNLTDQLHQLKLANQHSRSENETLQSDRDQSKNKISQLECVIQTKTDEIAQLTCRLTQTKQIQDTLRQ